MNLLQTLKNIEYERLAGSDDEKKAREYFKQTLAPLNLEMREEEFELNAFETGTAVLECGQQKYLIKPFGLNQDMVITGEMVFLDSPDFLIHQKGIWENKIILTNGYNRATLDAMKENKIACYISICGPMREATSLSHRQKNFENGYIPCCTVSYEEAKKLVKLSGKEVKITIQQKVEKRKAYNLVVDIPGTGQEKTLTYVVAHYDSVSTSPGALDNGAGSVIILKLAEYFAKNRPYRSLRVIFFSGEEMGLLGSYSHVRQNLEEIKERLGLVINVDVSGDDFGSHQFIVLGNNDLVGYVDGTAKEAGLMFKTSLDIYSSDCIPFSVYEVPAVNVARFGGEGTFHIHTSKDITKYASNRVLEESYQASLNLLKRVLNGKIYPVKKEFDNSLKEKIEKYLYNSTMEEPKLFWKEKYKK